MRTQNIVKACVAAGIAVVVSMVAGSASAQEVPVTAVGETTVLESGSYFDIVEERLEDPAPGFRAYNVWAMVNQPGQGRFVNAFEELNISNAHQVWDIDRRGAPLETAYDDFAGFADGLRAFDSFVLWTTDQQSAGSSPSETNDGSNPGNLQESVVDPEAGYADGDLTIGVGELGVTSRGGPPAFLGLTVQPGQLQLARVVIYDGPSGYSQAVLSGNLGGEGDGDAEGETDTFANVMVGQTMIIPEPSMAILALVGCVGALRLRRRNR